MEFRLFQDFPQGEANVRFQSGQVDLHRALDAHRWHRGRVLRDHGRKKLQKLEWNDGNHRSHLK